MTLVMLCTNLSLESSGFIFRNPPVLDHPLHDPQDIPAIVDPGMMPPHQIHVQRFEHPRHPLRAFVPVPLLEGRLDVDHPLLEVGGEEELVGFGRGVRGDDLGELLGKHRAEVPCSTGNEGVC